MRDMGWHYMKDELVDEKFDPTRPELLVYADDPCGGKRKLVAVEYAVPLALSKRAPAGFVGRADEWDANQTFQLWTLHAWVFEFNPDGVFAPFNPRVLDWADAKSAEWRRPLSGDGRRLAPASLRPATARAAPVLPRAALRES